MHRSKSIDYLISRIFIQEYFKKISEIKIKHKTKKAINQKKIEFEQMS